MTPKPPPALGDEHTDEVHAWLAADTADPLPYSAAWTGRHPFAEAFR